MFPSLLLPGLQVVYCLYLVGHIPQATHCSNFFSYNIFPYCLLFKYASTMAHVFFLSCLCEVHFILLICEAFLTTSEWYLPFFLTTLLLIYKTMHTCMYGDILARGWPPLCWCDSWFAGLMRWEEVVSGQWWFGYKHCLQAPGLPAHHLFVFFWRLPISFSIVGRRMCSQIFCCQWLWCKNPLGLGGHWMGKRESLKT